MRKTVGARFKAVQTLVGILQAAPENSDSRIAGQARPIKDPALRKRTRFFRAKKYIRKYIRKDD